jgi:integrase
VHGSKKDAQKYLTEALARLDRGEHAVGASRILVSSLLDDLLADYRINGIDEQGIERPRLEIHIRPYFGGMRAAKLGTTEIRRYIEKRQTREIRNGRRYGPASNATINRELALLRRALHLASLHEPPLVSRVPKFPMLAEDNVRKGFFEHDAFVRLRRELPEEIRPVITFAYYTGCRKGEILGLQWPQVDLIEHVVRLEPGETKNDDARIIPLVPELYQMLVLAKETRDRCFPESPWVFSRAGKPIQEFQYPWEQASKRAGLVNAEGDPERLFHDLRRTGVRNLIRAGVREKVAMLISGHKTRAVLDRYNIVDERDLKDAARKLAEYIARKDQPEPVRHPNGTPAASNSSTADEKNPSKLLN